MNEALELMLTGMGTVFTILILVVLLGKLIVLVTNRFYVEKDPVPVANTIKEREISPQTLAAIVAAVEAVTGGKGNVASIGKSDR